MTKLTGIKFVANYIGVSEATIWAWLKDYWHKELEKNRPRLQQYNRNLENIDFLISEGHISFFKKEQVENYIVALKSWADSRSIIMMVQDLDFRCLGYKKLIKIINRKGQKEKFKNNQKLLRDAQGILNMLQRFSNREQFFVYPKDIIGADCMEFLMDDDDYQNIEAYSFNNKIQQLAIKTRLPLKAFIDEFEKSNNLSYQPKSKNRSYTDEEEFVYSIAECYFENIGWPSLNNGFFTTVQLTKKFLSLLYKDPSRPIKKALKKFAATHQRQN